MVVNTSHLFFVSKYYHQNIDSIYQLKNIYIFSVSLRCFLIIKAFIFKVHTNCREH